LKQTILFAYVIIIISSCQKQLNDDKIFGEQIASDATMSEKVYAVKNTGVYSDSSSIAKKGYGIVMNGNSILERMNYANWKSTWINQGYPILNRAIGGTTWSEKIPYIKGLTTNYRPNDVILYDGENEFLRAAAGDNTITEKLLVSFNRTMDSIRRQNPLTRVYVVSMVTCPVLYKKGFSASIDKVNEGYQVRVARDAESYPDKIKFIDIRTLYPRTAVTKFEPDSIHIKLTAYTEFYNALKAALPKPGTGEWSEPVTETAPSAPPADTIPRTDTVVPPPPPPTDTVVVPPPPPSGNKLTIANAGADITIGKSWNYNPWIYGTQSKDPDGWIVSFTWTGVSGTPYKIVTPDAGKTRLDNLDIGVYVFRLTITDNKGGKATDDVKVTVTK